MEDKPAAANQTNNESGGFISNPFGLFKPSWQAVKLNLWTGVMLALLAFGLVLLAVIGFALASLVGRSGSTTIINTLVFVIGLAGVVLLIAFAIASIAITTVLFLRGAQGQKLGVKETLREARPYVAKTFFANLLVGLTILGGVILLVVPGIIFAAWFSLTPYIIVDENLGIIDAMKRSKSLVKGHVWEMLGMMGLPALLSILNIIPILGGLVSAVLSIAYAGAQAVRYLQLKQYQSEPSHTHWSNYAIVLLAPVLFFGFIGTGILSNLNHQKTLDQQIQDQINKSKQDSANPSLQ